MARIVRSPEARLDIAEIWAYIAEDNPPAADRLLSRIDRAIAFLATQPKSGKSIQELAPDLRFMPTGAYLIFYRPIEDGIEVARILHGARDISADFFRD